MRDFVLCKTNIRVHYKHYQSLLCAAIRDIKSKIPNIELYQWSESADTSILDGAIDLNTEISSIKPDPLIVQLEHSSPRDKLIYIYTSGTTGMPKAAVINNLRWAKLLMRHCGVRIYWKCNVCIYICVYTHMYIYLKNYFCILLIYKINK